MQKKYILSLAVALFALFAFAPGSAFARRKRSPAKNYAKLCSSCHGETGKGDGDMAADLDPKPRSFVDAAWKEKATGRKDDLKGIILEGGEKYKLSPQMKPFADKLDAKDAAKLVDFILELK